MTNSSGYEDIRRYDLALAGVHFLQNKDMEGGQRSLDKLVKSLDLGEDSEALLEGTKASEKGIVMATSVYAKKRAERVGALKLSELPEFYDKAFSHYVGNAQEEGIRDLFKSLDASMTYGDLRKKIAHAKAVMENKAGFSASDIEDAEKDAKKYSEVDEVIGYFEQRDLKKMVDPIQDGIVKDRVKEIAEAQAE